jgi:hypothetical protein
LRALRYIALGGYIRARVTVVGAKAPSLRMIQTHEYAGRIARSDSTYVERTREEEEKFN